MDLYDRKVIAGPPVRLGWALSKSMKVAKTTIPAWHIATKNRPIERSLKSLLAPTTQSDRGVQYACHAFTRLMKKTPAGCTKYEWKGQLSLRRSDGTMPWRKAFASAIRFKSLKSELVYQQNFQTQAMAKRAVFEYIEI